MLNNLSPGVKEILIGILVLIFIVLIAIFVDDWHRKKESGHKSE